MKAIWFFYAGAGIDILALAIALFFVFGDIASGTSGTNNPSMYKAIGIMLLIIAVGFWLKSAGKVLLANILLWIPALPLAGYGLMILLFIILKPDMK